MVAFVFRAAGHADRRVDVAIGTSLMRGALEAGVPGIVGECGGYAVCGTCRCRIAPDWQDKLAPPGADELDIIEMAGPDVDGIRLICQIEAAPELDGMILYVAT